MNPCDCCEAVQRASGCSNCVLDEYESTCSNSDCFLNYEGSCKISIARVCKASPEYEDDVAMHDCNECVRFTAKKDKDGVEYYTCGKDGGQIGKWDTACDNFKEVEE